MDVIHVQVVVGLVAAWGSAVLANCLAYQRTVAPAAFRPAETDVAVATFTIGSAIHLVRIRAMDVATTLVSRRVVCAVVVLAAA